MTAVFESVKRGGCVACSGQMPEEVKANPLDALASVTEMCREGLHKKYKH